MVARIVRDDEVVGSNPASPTSKLRPSGYAYLHKVSEVKRRLPDQKNMQPQRFQVYAAVNVLLIKDNKIFLIRRINTGWEDGKYCVPSGHIDQDETALQAAAREGLEEAGVKIKTEDLKLVQIMHRCQERTYIDLTFVADKWEGEPNNAEDGNFADQAEWFSLNELPENIIPFLKATLENYKNGIFYSEFGWE